MISNSLLIATTDPKFKSHCERIADYLKCSYTYTIDYIDNLDIEKKINYSATIIDTRGFADNEFAGVCQIVSQVITNCQIILIVDGKMSLEQMKFIYTSGARLILTVDDFFNQTKTEFFLTYLFNFEWIPVKSYDFLPHTEPDFMVYHLLSYKNKFVPIIHGEIKAKKFASMSTINELYIQRADLKKFATYVSSLNIKSQNSVLSKCRALYNVFFDDYINLVLTLSDNTKIYSFETGNKLLENIKISAKNLLDMIACVEDPWLVIDNLSQKMSNPLYRTPAVAIYCGITALNIDEDPLEVMLPCLLANIGLLKLSQRYLLDKSLSEEDHHTYFNHPLISLNTVLERRLPIPESIKKSILNSHENPVGTGFPKGRNATKVPWSSQLMQICEYLDDTLQIIPGQNRFELSEQKKKTLDLPAINNYSLDLISRIRKIWNPN